MISPANDSPSPIVTVPTRPSLILSNSCARALGAGQLCPRMPYQCLTVLRRRGNAAGTAIKQAHTEVFFEARKARAQRLLSEIQAGGPQPPDCRGR